MNKNGIGGSTPEIELEKLSDMTLGIKPITLAEFEARLDKAVTIMNEQNIAAVYLNAGTNLYYFTGTRWHASERMVGAILTAAGKLHYIAPYFEIGTLNDFMLVKGSVSGWQEDESPYELIRKILAEHSISSGTLAIDESTAFFMSNGIALANPTLKLIDAQVVTAGCRAQKSPAEIALMQRAKDMTLHVHKAVARILYEGITTAEVEAFIHEAHKRVGAPAGSYFVIVLFGEDSAFPHGVRSPKALENNEIVLIDTGCMLEGYISDITRTYIFGEANAEQSRIWEIEKESQRRAFEAAQIGKPCAEVDKAARDYLASVGFGPTYQLPGLPHRTGHGIGLDIHEWPYLVLSDKTPLAEGMCFSNEPMICVPDKFGIRHEDHFYMTENGARWFTEPAHSIDDPFGYLVP